VTCHSTLTFRVALLVGVALINYDSGQHQGKRQISGGRALLLSSCLTCRFCGAPTLKPFSPIAWLFDRLPLDF
jgi:hypothetical protein